jgi:hypothetical protein
MGGVLESPHFVLFSKTFETAADIQRRLLKNFTCIPIDFFPTGMCVYV